MKCDGSNMDKTLSAAQMTKIEPKHKWKMEINTFTNGLSHLVPHEGENRNNY